MSKNIIINKKNGDNYTSYYPVNDAQNIIRTTREVGYIQGDTLLEVVQDMANTYIAPNGELWNVIDNSIVDEGAMICGENNFVCVLAPYNEGDIHRINVSVSFDGGLTWSNGSYFNSNVNYRINNILGARASLGNEGLYEVVFIGKAATDSTEATTYKMQFKVGETVPYAVQKFSNQISLIGGMR